MKRLTLTLLALLIAYAAVHTTAQSTLQLERSQVQTVREDTTLRVTLPFTNQSSSRQIEDLKVTLLDERMQPIAQLTKKLVLLNGSLTEEVALPISALTPELSELTLRVDLMGNVWLQRLGERNADQEIQIIGQREWLQDAPATVRVIASQSGGGAIEGAKVIAALKQNSEVVATKDAESDSAGSATLTFNPDESMQGDYELSIRVESQYGVDEDTATISVKPGVSIFLTTDKPVYQPRQTMHIRALAAHPASGVPIAGENITLEAYDGRGNKVFKAIETSSEFGIISADFILADEVNQGGYRIKAIAGEHESEKEVQVYEYVLPKFRVNVETEEPFYMPGALVKGHIEARYFFGKPVDGSRVELVANCFDVGFNEFETLNGVTDDEGRWDFEFTIPERLVGQPSFQGNSIIQLDVRVTDGADHEEQKIHTFHVASAPLEIEAVAESGQLVAGVENEIYLIASTPDGSVAQPSLTIESPALEGEIEAQCDENGIAVITATPEAGKTLELTVYAEHEGERYTFKKTLQPGGENESILIRPDRGVYGVGDTMTLSVFTPGRGGEAAFVDIVKNGQTMRTHTARPVNGRADITQVITPDLTGTLELHAYRIRSDGNMIRDVRRVVAMRADDLRIEIAPDLDEYAPGQPAKIRIAVRNADGEPTQAALGMHIVDESVYSLSEKEPGLAKVFFAIERELLQPKVEIHGFHLDKAITLTAQPLQRSTTLSKALFAKLDDPASFGLYFNSVNEKREQAQRELAILSQRLMQRRPIEFGDTPEIITEHLLGEGESINGLPNSDPWGQPYVSYSANGRQVLASIGPDQILQSDDDIQVDYHRFDNLRRNWFFRQPQRGRVIMEELDAAPQPMALGMGMRGEPMAPPPGVAANVQDEGLGRANAVDMLQVANKSMQDQTHLFSFTASGDFDGEPENVYFDRLPEINTEDAIEQLQEEFQLNEDDTGPLFVGGELNEEALMNMAEAYVDRFGGELPSATEIAQAAAKPAERSVRVRRYFPETLYYTPELITDENGEASVELAMADSITTWRLSSMANAKSGALGDATTAMKVFKPFFVDLNLPTHLTRNDEVTIPVAVYNYLDTPQEVEVNLERSGWFDLLEGDYERTVTVAANEVTSVSFRIKADELGMQPITVFGWGTEDADAIGRRIEVRADGQAQFVNRNGRLMNAIEERFTLPAERLEGADRLWVKIYPGVFSQVVEGMDAILQMPYGCFEQTSSTTYPNVLALHYMQASDRITPAIEMKAREYINLGYQRLLTFEIPGGGFSVFGNPPATRVLSAYGLLEFSDMSEVYPIDPKVIERTRQWLLGERRDDGSWAPDQNYAHAEMWKSIQDNPLLVTAYIGLAIAESGGAEELGSTLDYLTDHADDADDAYTLAMVCNALLALDADEGTINECLDRLVDLAAIDDQHAYWTSEASMSFARGEHAWVETTAWAALALIDSGRYPSELGKALNWLIAQKSPNGVWSTTHGTVLALKALVRSLGTQTDIAQGTVAIRVNDELVDEFEITPEYADVFRQIDATNFIDEGENKVTLTLEGEGSMLYQVAAKYHEDWAGVIPSLNAPGQPGQAFDIQVEYDRTQLRTNDRVVCQVSATNHRSARAEMVMIDVGVPPGFRIETPDLDGYVDKGLIEKYTVMSRQLLIYIESMDAGEEILLDIPMKATLPMTAKAPESTVYEYYNPEVKSIAPPQELIVE